MKILFVRSRDFKGYKSKAFLKETNITGIYPPLGILYLAAVLKKQDYDVQIIDNQLEQYSDKVFREKIESSNPDVVLFSTTTLSWPQTVVESKIVKSVSSKIITGVGGPQLTVYPKESLQYSDFDFGIYGEGEITIVEVLNNLKKKKTLRDVKGCITREGNNVVIAPSCDPISNIDTIPFPAIDLVPYKRYFACTVKHPFFSMITSRGCPFKCAFCFQEYVGPYRARSPENVVDEMEMLNKDYGIKEIVTFDETFAVEEERAIKVCDLIRDRKLNFRWEIRTRINLITRELLQALKSSGCSRIHVGIESGNQNILNKMMKGIDISDFHKNIKLARDMGFETRGYFMLAYPEDNKSTMLQTIALAKELPLDWASFSITLGLPGTEIYKQALSQSKFPVDYWRAYTKGDALKSKPYFLPDGMCMKDLVSLKRKAYMEFYLRPKILWNIIKNLRMEELIRNTGTVVRLMPGICRSIINR